MAREAAFVRPPTDTPEPVEYAPAFEVFEELRQRAERDVANEDDVDASAARAGDRR